MKFCIGLRLIKSFGNDDGGSSTLIVGKKPGDCIDGLTKSTKEEWSDVLEGL